MDLGTQFLIQLMFNYYYLGAFLMGFFSSVTLVLPSPSFLVIFVTAPFFNPILLGFFAGLGAAVGEFTGYFAGWVGKKAVLKRFNSQIEDIKGKFERHHPVFVIFLFSVSPLPFDVVGVFCGVIKYPWIKFFVPLVAGKIIKYWVIAFAGYYGLTWAMGYFGVVL